MRLQYVPFDICVWINFVDLVWVRAFRVRRVLKCVFVSDRIKKEKQPNNQPTKNDCYRYKTIPKHIKVSKERYLLGKNTICKFLG